jgi:hypothetical protein
LRSAWAILRANGWAYLALNLAYYGLIARQWLRRRSTEACTYA